MELEYKYVVRHERDMTAVRWKEGGNFYLQVPPKGQLRVLDTWDDSMHKVEVRGTWQRMHAASMQLLRHRPQIIALKFSVAPAASRAVRTCTAWLLPSANCSACLARLGFCRCWSSRR